jgi:hypothetical protein
VNGVTVITHEAWDYEAQEMTFAMRRDNLALVDGDRVTVTVVPTHITGPWSLVIVDD